MHEHIDTACVENKQKNFIKHNISLKELQNSKVDKRRSEDVELLKRRKISQLGSVWICQSQR